MKRLLFFFIWLSLFFCSVASMSLYAQSHKWLTGGGASYSAPSGYTALEQVYESTVDAHGNVYILAEIMASGSATFDTITFPIQSVGYLYRAKTALLSYNCNGRIRWGKIIEGNNDIRFAGLLYSNGNIYISGAAPGGGASVRYFGPDSIMTGNYQGSWLIKYDTLGTMKWMRSQGADNIASYVPTANWYNKLFAQDTLIHCIKSIFGSGAQLSPAVTSQRGIYDYTYTPQGNLVNVVRLPITDSALVLNTAAASSLDPVTNTLFVSVTNLNTYKTAGVAAFDANRNLISLDTFSTTGTTFIGHTASTFRSGNALYTFGNYYGSNCTYKGHSFNYPFSGNGRFGFIMKTDLNNNVIWQKSINAVGVSSGITAWSCGINSAGNIILTGFAANVVIGSDTLLLPGPLGKIPIVIMDSTGSVQKMDYWNNNNISGGLESGAYISSYNGSIYISGTVTDSIWGGSSGYRSHGGQSDIFLAKYGYACNCTPPVSSFLQTTGSNGQINFTFTGTTAGIDSIRWQFGDGSISTAVNPSHAYMTAGSYNVCATVYNSCGGTQSCQQVIISCPQPVAAFTYTASGGTVNTSYTGTTPVDSVRWNFGTGTFVTGTTASHQYTSAGTYTICTIAYKGCGRDTSCQSVVIACPAPNASFTFSSSNTTTNFTYNGSTPVDSLRWNFGDGTNASGNAVTHTYAAGGTYNVCLIAYKGCGRDTVCQQVTVSCPLPDAAFNYIANAQMLEVQYTGTQAVTAVQWDFGDGSTGSGNTATHNYAATGSYTVCVKGTNSCGDSSNCKVITLTSETGIGGTSLHAVKVYPNPATRVLIVEHVPVGTRLIIYNVAGQKVGALTVEQSKEEMDIDHLLPGTYMLKMINGSQQGVWQFVKE